MTLSCGESSFTAKQRSQGGAKLPTGGICRHAKAWIAAARERLRSSSEACRVSRSGEMPEPTVIVRMKEIAQHLLELQRATGAAAWAGEIAHALIHWLHLFESKP